jgi:hypothetical protein
VIAQAYTTRDRYAETPAARFPRAVIAESFVEALAAIEFGDEGVASGSAVLFRRPGFRFQRLRTADANGNLLGSPRARFPLEGRERLVGRHREIRST